MNTLELLWFPTKPIPSFPKQTIKGTFIKHNSLVFGLFHVKNIQVLSDKIDLFEEYNFQILVKPWYFSSDNSNIMPRTKT